MRCYASYILKYMKPLIITIIISHIAKQLFRLDLAFLPIYWVLFIISLWIVPAPHHHIGSCSRNVQWQQNKKTPTPKRMFILFILHHSSMELKSSIYEVVKTDSWAGTNRICIQTRSWFWHNIIQIMNPTIELYKPWFIALCVKPIYSISKITCFGTWLFLST